MPVALPKGVTCEVAGRTVRVSGPAAKLETIMPPGVTVRLEGEAILVAPDGGVRLKERDLAARHGLARALIHNMVVGVTKGYSQTLELMGAGFRPTVQGQVLNMTLGFSHPVKVDLPAGVKAAAVKMDVGARGEERHQITLTGADKAALGELAAKIRLIKKADVYKGKGIRYKGEVVRR
ncbi:MAG: 50S ribosomal protein L6, partial [bacterium]